MTFAVKGRFNCDIQIDIQMWHLGSHQNIIFMKIKEKSQSKPVL